MDSPANSSDSPVKEPPGLSRTSAPPPAQTVPHSPANLTDPSTDSPPDSAPDSAPANTDPLVKKSPDLSSGRVFAQTLQSPHSPPQALPHRRDTGSLDQGRTGLLETPQTTAHSPGNLADPTLGPADQGDHNSSARDLLEASVDSDALFFRAPEDVDDTCDETDSTRSLTGSTLQYQCVNDRQFHAEWGQARYWAPNDEKQLYSEAVQDYVIGLMMERKGLVHHGKEAKVHFAAPVDKCQKVLDIGTGTGLWAIDFADTYPGAQVIGTDLSPIQPNWVPPNAEFQIDDFCDHPWTFEPNSFDFVHSRWNIGSVTSWDAHFEQAYQVLRPGGFLESHEPWPDIEQNEGAREAAHLKEWGGLFQRAGERTGKPFDVAGTGMQKRSMEKAGFVDVNEVELQVPIGYWPKDKGLKEIGNLQLEAFSSDIEGYMGYIACEIMGWSKQETDIFAAHIRREVRDPKHRSFFRQTVVWGRKP